MTEEVGANWELTPVVAFHNGENDRSAAVVGTPCSTELWTIYLTTVTRWDATGHAHYTIQHPYAYQVRVWQYVGTMWRMSIWHYSGNIVTETTADVSRSRLGWHD